KTGYFTLRPREDEAGFERADNAHNDVLRWIQTNKDSVLYLTGASGTGKSSLLSSWVIPKLKQDKVTVLHYRGYEDVLVRLAEDLLTPGVIWDRPPSRTTDLKTLLTRAVERLENRRLLVVIDQFEELLIPTDEEKRTALQQFLS